MEDLKTWYPVRMKFEGETEWYEDYIKGYSPEDALNMAKLNWTEAVYIEIFS